MRFLLAAVAALLIAAPVAAQPTEYGFSEDLLVRVGQGDLELVSGTEPAGWTQAEYLRFQHDGNMTTLGGIIEAGRVALDCTCGNITIDGTQVIVGSDVAAGEYVLRQVRTISGEHFISEVQLDRGQTSRLVAYVPDGMMLFGAQTGAGLPCTQGGCTIHEVTPIPSGPVLIVPDNVFVEPTPTEGDDGMFDDILPWFAGILIGALVWAYLVKQGYVQKRRKQEVVKAAHVEAAEAESKETLEARKRVLMSGLKELEKAKMAKEIDSDVYDALKAELKKETVTVMRALEAAE